MNTLIVYSSKYGFTEKCIEILSKELNHNIDKVNLKKNEHLDILNYDNIIIGGPIYYGNIHKEIKKFC